MKGRKTATALLVVLSMAACGSKSSSTSTSSAPKTPSAEAHAALQQAVGLLGESKLEMDGTVAADVTPPSGVASVDAHPVNTTVQAVINGFSNIRASLKGKVGSDNLDNGVIEVNGVFYESKDGGKTWSQSDGQPASMGLIEIPFEYLFSGDKVTDEGPGSVKGQKTEHYQVTFRSQLALTVGGSISNVEPGSPNFAHAMASPVLSSGQVTVSLDTAGHIVQEDGYVEISVPASAVQSGASGNVLVRQTVSCTFGKYGTAGAAATAPPTH